MDWTRSLWSNVNCTDHVRSSLVVHQRLPHEPSTFDQEGVRKEREVVMMMVTVDDGDDDDDDDDV